MLADAVEFFFDGQFVEAGERQAEEQTDAAVQDREGIVKGALDCSGFPETAAGSGMPQCAAGRARQDRLPARRYRKP
jgi:hypothetical protein